MLKTSEKTAPKPAAVKALAKGDHVFLVDGSSYIFRAYHALPPLIREAVRAFDLPCLEQGGFEADDLIATYAREAGERGAMATIVSSDKDLMQLVTDRVTMYDTMKDRRIGISEVIEKFGVPPEKVVEVQALAGDSTDNVPGVPGTLSVESPASACTSTTFSGGTPNFSITWAMPMRRSFMVSNIVTLSVTSCIRSLSEETMVAVATRSPASRA